MIVRAACVAPISSAPIRDACVETEGERIVRVGPRRAWPETAPLEDLGDALLLPGLVNPHTHLELGAYHGRIAPAPFWDWLPALVRLRRESGALPREQTAAEEWAWRSLRSGVTTVGDISRQNVAWRGLQRVPIRKVCFAELLAIADQPPRNVNELRAAVESIEEDALLTAGISPHAPYSVPKSDIRDALELARRLNRPWTLHLGETREEVAFLAGDAARLPLSLGALLGPAGITAPGQGVARFLADVSPFSWGGAVAHVNYLTDADVAALAAGEWSAVYCPRAHQFFGHEPHPFQRLIAAGARIAIGTDSPASNDDVSIMAELRHIRSLNGNRLSAEQLLRMATLDGAAALRLEDRIGSLSVGKLADICAFPLARDGRDPFDALLSDAPPPTAVWVAGKRVV